MWHAKSARSLVILVVVLGAFAAGILFAPSARSLPAGTASANPSVPNPGHPYTEIELPAGTWTGLDADKVDGLHASELSGVPSGFSILGDTAIPPAGYAFTGTHLLTPEIWTAKASMPTARYGLAAAVVNNKIYAIGGWNGSYLATVEEYDPATNIWTAKANMPTARYYLAAAAVSNKIYAIGGYNGSSLATVEEYDPATDTWTAKASMPTARYMLATVAVSNKIYAIGGYNDSFLATVKEYDPATDTWTARASMPTARQGPAAAVASLDTGTWQVKEVRIEGALHVGQEMVPALKLLEHKRVNIKPAITEVIPLADAQRAFDSLHDQTNIAVLLKP